MGARTASTIAYRAWQPGTHAGGLYLYRAPDSETFWTHLLVSFDGVELGELHAGGYLYVQARPGRHTIKVRDAAGGYLSKKTLQGQYEVELERGKNSVVRFPVLDGILLRFGPGYERELRGMREDGVKFLAPVDPDR